MDLKIVEEFYVSKSTVKFEINIIRVKKYSTEVQL